MSVDSLSILNMQSSVILAAPLVGYVDGDEYSGFSEMQGWFIFDLVHRA